jgi:drug/metabolite transporter (DMT)-like permease
MNNYDPEETQSHLREINQELERLKQNILGELSQEIEQLQSKKDQLILEIQELKTDYQNQLIKQQELAKNIAPDIAKELQKNLIQQLSQQGLNNDEASLQALQHYHDQAHSLIASVDSILRTTFETLKDDLSSYQSSITQQIGQMYSLEQQGEAILDELVSRIQGELIPEKILGDLSNLPLLSENIAPISSTAVIESSPITEISNIKTNTNSIKSQSLINSEITGQKTSFSFPLQTSNLLLGFGLILFSVFALYLQNIVVTILLNKSSLFSLFDIGGYLAPNMGSIFFIVFLKMAIFVPTLFLMTTFLSPHVWFDIKNAIKDKNLFILISICAFFLFVSSVLIYFSLGFLSAGIAITTFFIFPVINLFGSWLLFGIKPTFYYIITAIGILLGILIIVLQGSENLPTVGLICAGLSGISFAIHLLLIQVCTKTIHPVPFSLINFGVIFLLSLVSVLISLPQSWGFSIGEGMTINVILGGIILGGLSLLSYLANNFGITLIGAARASIFSVIGPFLTSFLAWIMIGQSLTGLEILGILIITVGVTVLNLDRLFSKPKSVNFPIKRGN